MSLRLGRIFLAACAAMAFLAVGLYIVSRSGEPLSVTGSGPLVLARSVELPTVAEVNGVPIYPETLVRMYLIDGVLAQWLGGTQPQGDDLLERAVNAELVSQAALQAGYVFPEELVSSTLTAFLSDHGYTQDQLNDILLANDISPDVFLVYYRRLLAVDTFSRQQAEATGQSVSAYITTLRQGAEVVAHEQNLPALPMVSLSAATASPALTPTSTPLSPTSTPAPSSTPPTTPAETPSAPVGPERGTSLGALAPDFSLTTLDGDSIGWQDLVGTPSVLSFWVTWCGHCSAQTRWLIDAYGQHTQTEVVFVGINVKESVDMVSTYVAQQSIPYEIALDQDGSVAGAYRVQGLPTTYFLDAEGRVSDRHVGELTKEELSGYLGALLPAQ